MTEPDPKLRAIKLMREALVLLDELGESKAAVYLQWAHDIVVRVPPLQPGEEIELPEDPDAP